MYIPHFFIHSSVDVHLGCFHFLVIVNNAVVNMGMQILRQDPAMNSFGYISRSELTRLYGNSMILLSAPSSRTRRQRFCAPSLLEISIVREGLKTF